MAKNSRNRGAREELIFLLPQMLISELRGLVELHGEKAKVMTPEYLGGIKKVVNDFLTGNAIKVSDAVENNLKAHPNGYSMESLVDELMKDLLPYARLHFDPDLRDFPFPLYGVTHH